MVFLVVGASAVVAVVAVVLTAVALRPHPVAVPPPITTNDAVRRACAALGAALPSSVDDQERRSTSPTSASTAAWGDPAIVLRCGVKRPAALRLTSELVTVDGVDWLPVRGRDGYTFTTVRRTAYVEVRVPSAYSPEVNALTDLAAAISTSVPIAALD